MVRLPVKVPASFRIIAHRGASGYAPENTLAAFRLAEEMGVSEVELDLQFSKDRQLILCHDRSLDRYGYPDMRVVDLTLDELLELDIGSWYSPHLFGGERLITLETLLGHFGRHFTYHVELKAPMEGMVESVLKILAAHNLSGQAIITSFSFNTLGAVRKLAPDMNVGWLVKVNGLSGNNIARAAKAGFFQICPRADGTNRENVLAAHSSIPEVRAHSVLGVPEMLQAIEAGCDGLTLNWPDWLIHEAVENSGETAR
ncbi:MAG: glycerophosphodiester phosphodiesterase [Anaerolineales bacterium]|nr:MAG: glycerophosphodiester phosphodiesterase [Anaerolineales bacterium]